MVSHLSGGDTDHAAEGIRPTTDAGYATERFDRLSEPVPSRHSPGAEEDHRERRRGLHRAVDPGHLPRAVPDARRPDPAHGGQDRLPDRRLLVPAPWQGRDIRLPHTFYHH